MHRTRHRLILAVCVGCAMSSSLNAQKKIEWKFKKGQQRASEVAQQITQVVNGESLRSTATLYVSSIVDDVDASGTAIITKTITRATTSIALPGGSDIEYDSATGEPEKGSAKMFADALAPLIGRQVQMKVAANGKATEAKQLNAPAPSKKAAGLFSPMVRGRQLEQLLAKSIPVFPKNELVEGGKWNDPERRRSRWEMSH